jgi:hypothetical protein
MVRDYDQFIAEALCPLCPICKLGMSDDGHQSNPVFLHYGQLCIWYGGVVPYPHATVNCNGYSNGTTGHCFSASSGRVGDHLAEFDYTSLLRTS